MSDINKHNGLINRAAVKAKLIQAAQDHRFHWKQFQPRVSGSTLDKIEAIVDATIRDIVQKLPSKGQTI